MDVRYGNGRLSAPFSFLSRREALRAAAAGAAWAVLPLGCHKKPPPPAPYQPKYLLFSVPQAFTNGQKFS